jgi:hypothetical protein
MPGAWTARGAHDFVTAGQRQTEGHPHTGPAGQELAYRGETFVRRRQHL